MGAGRPAGVVHTRLLNTLVSFTDKAAGFRSLRATRTTDDSTLSVRHWNGVEPRTNARGVKMGRKPTLSEHRDYL
jgi:hypothetical protein